jgi:WD40 repeat protein/class 3 adenylate cyclase
LDSKRNRGNEPHLQQDRRLGRTHVSVRTRPAAGRAAPPARPEVTRTQRLAFVFTDIEGSTRLLEKLREQYAEVLATHGRLIEQAVSSAGGEVVDTQGDAFFLAFRAAPAAVTFAADAQRALERERWPANSRLRVRMGVHVGEATPTRGGYVGLDVHRAARIADAGHGGQVLLSAEAAQAVGQQAGSPGLRPLGEHHVKDFDQPIALHQLVIDGLQSDFPPPRSFEEPDQEPAAGLPPYLGLAHFEERDAELFFGRETLVARLTTRLRKQPFLAVVGASGSGKSSVVRAGLIPALRRNGVNRVVLLTPTADPFAALSAALAPDGGANERTELEQLLRAGPTALSERLGRNSVLIVDQAEELFSQCRDEAQRAAFIERVLAATEAGGYVVLTLRADFYDRLAGYPGLRDAVAAQQEYLGPMNADELRRAITGPADAGDWRLMSGLVELILHDVGTEPGALPLLSHALLETWQRRRGRLLSLRGYLDSGGVNGAIARSADRLMAELTPAQQDIARAIFLRLTEFGAGTPDTRRRAPLGELPGDDDAAAVLQRLAERRLVVLGADTAEVAHEALIREWPTLREWLAADREALRLHRGLTEAASEWQRASREPSLLYRGARLAAALDWAEDHGTELNALEREFLEESRLASEREAQRQRQVNRRLRFLLAGAGVFLVLAIGAGAYAALEANRAEQEAARAEQEAAAALGAQQEAETARGEAETSREEAETARGEAENQAQEAESARRDAEERAREAHAQALYGAATVVVDEDPQLAILLALEARALGIDPPPEAVTALHRAVQDARAVRTIQLAEPPVRTRNIGVALSPDGTTVYAATDSGSVQVFDVATGNQLNTYGQPRYDDYAWAVAPAVAVSPDGRIVAIVDADAMVLLWNVEDGTERRLQAPGFGTGFPKFSPNGELLVVQTEAQEDRDGSLNMVTVFDLATGSQLVVREFEFGVDVEFHPDGSELVVTDCACADEGQGQVVLLGLADGSETVLIEGMAAVAGTVPRTAAISPDARWIATGGSDNDASLWDATTGELVRTFSGHSDWVNLVTFSPQGDRLATTSLDGTSRVWDVATGAELAILRGQGGFVDFPAFSADGTRLVTGSSNFTATIWNLAPAASAEVARHEFGLPVSRLRSVDVRGDTVAILARPCIVLCLAELLLIDAATGQVTGVGEQHAGAAIALAPGGRHIVSQDGYPWEGDPLGALGAVRVHDAEGGDLALTDVCPFWVGLRPWEPSQEDECETPPGIPWRDQVWSIAFTPDGSLFAMVGFSGMLSVWDAQTGARIDSIVIDEDEPTLVLGFRTAFSPDGATLAVFTTTGRLIIYDPTTLTEQHLVEAVTGVFSPDARVGFSPDGSWLALANSADQTRVFSVDDWSLVHELPVRSRDLEFSPDGGRLLTADADGFVRLWDVATGRELHRLPGAGQSYARFLADERHIATFDDESLRIMTLDVDELLDIARQRVTRSLTVAECEKYDVACETP